MKRIVVFALFLMLLIACKHEAGKNRSFCCWKTGFGFTKQENAWFNDMNVSHFYVRLFDVDWNPYEKMALPVATVRYSNYEYFPQAGSNITPAIYITNTVLENSDNQALDSLAKRISVKTSKLVEQYIKDWSENIAEVYCNKRKLDYNNLRNIVRDSVVWVETHQIKKQFTEILIDCDWSINTQQSYFYLLNKLKQEFKGYQLSSTIRLWQYKYRTKAGIPPVQRGLLMCYSLGNPKDYNTHNSIICIEELKKYLNGTPYPLKLDVALPLFSWGVLFRSGVYKGLISDPEIIDKLADTSTYISMGDNHYLLKNDVVIGNSYYRQGDEIRMERLTENEMGKIVDYVSNQLIIPANTRVSFFSWDTNFIKYYGVDNIDKYYRTLSH